MYPDFGIHQEERKWQRKKLKKLRNQLRKKLAKRKRNSFFLTELK
jgi:hypothetical protein